MTNRSMFTNKSDTQDPSYDSADTMCMSSYQDVKGTVDSTPIQEAGNSVSQVDDAVDDAVNYLQLRVDTLIEAIYQLEGRMWTVLKPMEYPDTPTGHVTDTNAKPSMGDKSTELISPLTERLSFENIKLDDITDVVTALTSRLSI